MMFSIYCGILFFTLNSTVYLKKRKLFLSNFYILPSSLIKQCLSEHLVVRARISHLQCPDEIVPDKSTSTTLRNTPLTYKHDSAGLFSITGNQLNRVYVRARDYAKLYWSTCPVLFRPDTGHLKLFFAVGKCLFSMGRQFWDRLYNVEVKICIKNV
jgi:hypothetical protein